MSGGRDWTRKEEQEALSLCRNEVKYEVIAKKLGRSFRSVAQKLRVLKQLDGGFDPQRLVPKRPKGTLEERVKQLWRPGIADAWLGNLLDVHKTLIGVTRRRLGIPRGIIGKPPHVLPWLKKLDRIKDKDMSLKICVRLWECGVCGILDLLSQATGEEYDAYTYRLIYRRLDMCMRAYDIPRMRIYDGESRQKHFTIDEEYKHGDKRNSRQENPRFGRLGCIIR